MICLEYRLEQEEIEESLLCAKWKQEGILKKWNILILSVLMGMLLFYFYANTENSLVFIYLLVANGLLFLLLYFPAFRRRQVAQKLFQTQAKVILHIDEDGKTMEGSGIVFPMTTKQTEVLLSEMVMTIKNQKDILCIPYRVLTNVQKEKLMIIFKEGCTVMQMITK